MNRSWKHDELAADLAGYLRGPRRMVWTDMQMGPSGSPRPDVFTLETSYSQPKPMAYEIKISVPDLRSDTTSGKWQKYLKYASGVVFAVPDGLCTKNDIPDTCGLIVRKDQVWRYAKKPIISGPIQFPMDATMKLLIDGVSRVRENTIAQPRSAQLWRENEEVRKKFGAAVALAARDLVQAQSSIEDAKALLSERRKEVDRKVSLYEDRQMAAANAALEPIKALQTEICEFLGIPKWFDHSANRAFNEMKRSTDADARVKDAESALKNAIFSIRRACDQACPPDKEGST